MIKDVRKIKGLQSQLKELEGDMEAMKNEIANKQREFNQKLQTIKTLRDQIAKLDSNTNNEARVSEHAIVRYFERVKGFNIAEVEKEILNPKVLDLVDKLGGNGTYPNEGYSVVMKDFTVVTIK